MVESMTRVAFLLATVPLCAQGTYHVGTVVNIREQPEIRHFEYTIWDGVCDAWIGASQTPIRLQMKAKVKYALVSRSLYVIDDDGNVQETVNVAQEEMVRTPWLMSPRWLPDWFRRMTHTKLRSC
jgi:hypothetical protein